MTNQECRAATCEVSSNGSTDLKSYDWESSKKELILQLYVNWVRFIYFLAFHTIFQFPSLSVYFDHKNYLKYSVLPLSLAFSPSLSFYLADALWPFQQYSLQWVIDRNKPGDTGKYYLLTHTPNLQTWVVCLQGHRAKGILSYLFVFDLTLILFYPRKHKGRNKAIYTHLLMAQCNFSFGDLHVLLKTQGL